MERFFDPATPIPHLDDSLPNVTGGALFSTVKNGLEVKNVVDIFAMGSSWPLTKRANIARLGGSRFYTTFNEYSKLINTCASTLYASMCIFFALTFVSSSTVPYLSPSTAISFQTSFEGSSSLFDTPHALICFT